MEKENLLKEIKELESKIKDLRDKILPLQMKVDNLWYDYYKLSENNNFNIIDY